MRKRLKLFSLILAVWLTIFCQPSVQAEDTQNIVTQLPMTSNGVIFADDHNKSAVTENLHQWWIFKSASSAALFQYDLSVIAGDAKIIKAEWNALVTEAVSWTANFRQFEYEKTFDKSVTYNSAVSDLGYKSDSSYFLSKSISSSDYTEVSRLDDDASSMQFTVDMTQAVTKARDAGLTKFNFAVEQNKYFTSSNVYIPMAWQPNPQLVITMVAPTGVDEYTTTRYTDWFVNYHLTSNAQITAGIKGGEAGQAGQALAISPTNPDLMVCGTDMNGIWRSEDGGKNWVCADGGLMTIGVSDLFFDPSDSNIVYALGSTGKSIENARKSIYPGIYRSEDAGKTWDLVKYLPTIQTPGRYFGAGTPDKNGVCPIYVGTNTEGILSGVYVSYDKGITWQNCGLDTQVIRDLYVKDDFISVSTTTGGLFLSFNAGKTWNAKIQGFEYGQKKILSCIADPYDNSHLFCISEKLLYESTDSGENWNVINNVTDVMVSSFKLLEVMETKNNTYTLYLGTSIPGPSVRYSTDEGITFNKPEVHSEFSFMAQNIGYISEPIEICKNNNNIFAFFDGDLHKSTDGGKNFYPSQSGYSGMRASDFVFDKDNNNYLGIAQIDRGFMQTVSGDTISEYPAFDYSISLSLGRYNMAMTVLAAEKDPEDNNHIIACVGGSGLYILRQSWDNGKTWSDISESLQYDSVMLKINRIYFHPENPDIIYAANLKSIDGGATWFDVGRAVCAMSPSNGDIVYSLGTDDIYKSENGGLTWNMVADNLYSMQRCIVDSENPYKLYVGTFSTGLYIIDLGKTSDKITLIRENAGLVASEKILNIKDISQDPADANHLICGGANNTTYAVSQGIFESFDGGVSWKLVEGLPASKDVWTVEFHPNLPKVYIGTSAGTFVYEWQKNPDNMQF